MTRCGLAMSIFLLGFGAALTGCGASRDCTPTPLVVTVSPATAIADHAAAATGNQVQFSLTTTGGQVPSGCAQTALSVTPMWKDSDPTDVQFGNANGLATCVNATSGATTVTVTASSGSAGGTGTAQLTCR
jgi:hypothetical protein